MTKRCIYWLLLAPPLWFIALIVSSYWVTRTYRLSETAGLGLEAGSLIIFHCAPYQNFYAPDGYRAFRRSWGYRFSYPDYRRKTWETFFAHGESAAPWGEFTVVDVWPLAYVAAIPLATIAIGKTVRAARESARSEAGLCTRCGYDLRATPRRCPECGTAPSLAASVSLAR